MAIKRTILRNSLFVLATIFTSITALAFIEWNEGFFYQNEIPIKKRLGIESSVIDSAVMVSGAYSYTMTKNIRIDEIQIYKDRYCSDNRTKIWFEKMCTQLTNCYLSQGLCKIDYRGHCGGVVIDENYFVTAKHCVDDEDQEIKARFLNEDKSGVVDFVLERIDVTNHDLPYDIAILKIHGWPKGRLVAEISSNIVQYDPVIAIGFPDTGSRTNRSAEYSWANNELRVSIGRITNANKEKKSFCNFSNDIDTAEPESWVLEANCSQIGPFMATNSAGRQYEAREERNVLLTNTDMIHGMSGSALFNKAGQLIGIGTTILKNKPPLNYSPNNNAVYLKAENIRKILNQM